ncbi:MAG: prephenate dehydrogenase [Alphaproteobacteria bacterium]|nr:prephenate dehydrogenase [Alphaproteobacteria bacterium]
MTNRQTDNKKTLGLFGLGAFGRLIVPYLARHFDLCAFDPSAHAVAWGQENGVAMGEPAAVAACDIVVLGPPVPRMAEAVALVKPHLRDGALVLDVGSVKYTIAQLLEAELPRSVDIVCTHPLFGPQSGKNGIKGLKIAVCPVRGEDRARKVAAFLSEAFGLEVIETTAEAHDREMAMVQGLTHMVAKVLLEMEPLPKTMTTKSYERLMESVDMLRYDSMELFLAIERDNPFAKDVRKNFFAKADALRGFLEAHDAAEA